MHGWLRGPQPRQQQPVTTAECLSSAWQRIFIALQNVVELARRALIPGNPAVAYNAVGRGSDGLTVSSEGIRPCTEDGSTPESTETKTRQEERKKERKSVITPIHNPSIEPWHYKYTRFSVYWTN